MRIVDVLLGRPLATREEGEHRVGILAAIPMLGLDALASAAYGPEAALTILIPLGVLGPAYGVPIIGVILALLAILFVSYRQTMSAYPSGGGSYTVAKENLGVSAGLIAAAALMLDYILVVSVGISAGVGALASAFPALHGAILPACLGILLLIVVVNLRGVKESGVAFMLPTYLFIATMFVVLGIGVFRTATAGGSPVPIDPPATLGQATKGVSLVLLLHAFASGCTAMTGVEAVSNGMSAFAEPRVKVAHRTLSWIVAILALMLIGIGFLARTYHVGATEPGSSSYESVISQLTAAIVGRGFLYYLNIAGVLAVLALSANTGFADFPRLCRLLADDEFLPHAFGNRGRRLVYSRGIVILAVLSGAILIAFGGITDHLIPLFAVGALLAFTMSQAGMVVHWRRVGDRTTSMAINALGAVATGTALAVVLYSKFNEGAWITLLLLPVLFVTFTAVRNHYLSVARQVECAAPVDVSNLLPAIVVVPIKGWDRVTQKAVEFALRLSTEVEVVHIAVEGEDLSRLNSAWQQYVDRPLRDGGWNPPNFLVVSSPYRRLFSPLLEHLQRVAAENPGRQIAVIIPELVEGRWWHYLLHNQRATGLKAMLLLRGDRRFVVINVPWYLGD